MVIDSTNSDEEDSSSQGKPSDCPKAADGTDARAGINFKSNNETCGVFIGEEVNEETSNDKRTETKCTPAAGSGGGVYSKEGANRKKCTAEGMPMESTAQDTLRRNLIGLRGELRNGKSWDANCETEAQSIPGDPVDLRDDFSEDKGQDVYNDMEAQMLLLKKHGENNFDDGPSVSIVPWYLAESQPTRNDFPSPTASHGTKNNSDADLDERLADFTKRVRQNRGNLVKKKNNPHHLKIGLLHHQSKAAKVLMSTKQLIGPPVRTNR
ncbi:hypothetical protein Ancab_012049 [Ancistrocladus abbreviatus]